MSIATTDRDELAVLTERLLLGDGDLSKFSPDERLRFAQLMCERRGVDVRDGVVQLIRSQGRVVLYWNSLFTDSQRAVLGITIESLTWDIFDNICVARCEMRAADGRRDVDIGAVSVEGLKGVARENAIMKSLTKAKRRTTLSILGMGSSESEDLPETARPAPPEP